MRFDIDAIAADLTDDGDTVEIGPAVWTDGGTWTFKLRITPDYETTYAEMEDPEVFGKIAHIDDDGRVYENVGGRVRAITDPGERPPGFDRAAEKMTSEAYRGGGFWYQSPPDFKRFKGSGFKDRAEWERRRDEHRDYVRHTVSWGYQHLGIEVSNVRVDGYHHEWAAWVGGIEYPMGFYGEVAENYRKYIAELIRDQLEEVIDQIQQEVPA